MDIDTLQHPDSPEHLARTWNDLAQAVAIMNGTQQHHLLDGADVLGHGRVDVYVVDILWEILQSPTHKVEYLDLMGRLRQRDALVFSETSFEAAFKIAAEKVTRNQRVVASPIS